MGTPSSILEIISSYFFANSDLKLSDLFVCPSSATLFKCLLVPKGPSY